MSKEKMSAKDKKFEEERAKYRSQIRELEREVKNEKIKNYQLREELEKKDSFSKKKMTGFEDFWNIQNFLQKK